MSDREPFLHNEDKDAELLGKGQKTYLLDRGEYVPNKGALIYIKGGLYPRKGYPAADSVRAINQIKRVLVESLKYPVLFLYNKEKLITSYNKIASKSMRPYLMKKEYLCPTARLINNILGVFLIKIGISVEQAMEFANNFAHIFEYDDAYRYRLQDISNETYTQALQKNPRKEISRLLKIYVHREQYNGIPHAQIYSKFQMVVNYILLALLIPKYKKAFVIALNVGIEQMKPDVEDWYWMCARTDYLFGGYTDDERKSKFDVWPTLYDIDDL